MNANANDGLIAALGIGAMLALRSAPAAAPSSRSASAAKFGPAALAPLFATGDGERRRRAALLFSAAFAIVAVASSSRSSPTAGCASSTTARSATRRPAARRSASGARRPRSSSRNPSSGSPPRRSRSASPSGPRFKTPVQIAALARAVTIAVQLGATHWFYFYVVWFLPFALIASFASQRRIPGAQPIVVSRRRGSAS